MSCSFDYSELNTLAFNLLRVCKDQTEPFAVIAQEAIYRSVVNRAYYAAFLLARDKAGITNTGGSVHQDVIKYYQAHQSSVSNRLMQLKKLRSDADYSSCKQMQLNDANKALKISNNVFNALI